MSDKFDEWFNSKYPHRSGDWSNTRLNLQDCWNARGKVDAEIVESESWRGPMGEILYLGTIGKAIREEDV